MKMKSIELVKPRTVYAVETSTHTFIADGLAHHNCRGCNGYGNGKYAEYSVWFINKYGLEKWQEKIALSHRVVKLDYQEVYNKYKLKSEELKNEGSF